MRLVYIGQYRDSSGCGVAARSYIKALHTYVSESSVDMDLKLYAPVAERSTFQNNIQDLIDIYEFKSDEEINSFMSEPYTVVWHIPSVMAMTSDFHFGTPPGCSPSLRKLLVNAEKNIPLVVWETDKIPKDWTNLYDYHRPSKIIVPSDWCQEVVKNSVPGMPCDVIPHVIHDTKSDNKTKLNLPVDLSDKFVILSMSQWNNRKGFDKLIRAYAAEFRNHEDTVLLIKTYGSLMHTSEEHKQKEKQQIFNLAKQLKSTLNFDLHDNHQGPALAIISDYLPKEQINWIYDNASVSSLLTRGEAFGFTIAESLINEVPVVVSNTGGHLDYICKDSIFPVNGMMDMCLEPYPPYCVEGQWFEPNIRSAQEQLREAYNLWKDNPQKLKEMGKKGREYILSHGYDYYSVGEALYHSVLKSEKREDIVLESPVSDIKSKRRDLVEQIKTVESLEEKTGLLKDSFKGETCYMLSCGPSVKNYTPQQLRDKLSDKLVFGIKTIYEYVPDLVDFHFFNCCNLPMPKGKNNKEHYLYNEEDRPVVVGSSNYDLGVRWGKEQELDLFYPVPIRTSVDSFLIHNKRFDDYCFSNTLKRPCGPGMMWETVFYMVEHVGASELVILGLDLTTDPKNPKEYEHFYDKNKQLYNPGDILDWEINDARIALSHLFKWFEEKGVKVTLCSDISRLDNTTPRVRI